MNTKEKILREALNLFSIKGYDPVTIRDIAGAVGIKESSIYNHYINKQDLFDSILKEYSGRWSSFFSGMHLTGQDGQFRVDDSTVNQYKTMTDEQFARIALSIFDYYFTDEINVKLRRFLTIEQYRNPELTRLFRSISFDESLEFQSRLFDSLIKEGCFVDVDPYILALAFFSPIFLIFYKYDSSPEGLEEARSLFSKHIRQFSKIYGTNEINKQIKKKVSNQRKE